MNQSNEMMIRLTGVSKRFDSHAGVMALRDIDVAVPRGQLLSIVGPSGSGKSTLLNLIGGLDRPSSGDVAVDGTSLAGASDDALTLVRRDKVGFVFQFFNLLHLRGWPRAKVVERARELLDMVRLGDRTAHLPDQLSGGQRQRVAIARALSGYPPILLADEPTGNLDSRMGNEILDLLRDLHQRLGSTIVVVTHDATVAASCERTLTLQDGRIIRDIAR